MALKPGRVGVNPSQVDPYGKIIGGGGGSSGGGGAKLYYKDFELGTDASYGNFEWQQVRRIAVEGYTPVMATLVRVGDGYEEAPRGGAMVVEGDYPDVFLVRVFSVRHISSSYYKVRVFYVENSNMEVIE